MKAVVLEIRDKKAAILTHGGQIIKVSNKDYLVGQEISIMESSERIVDMARSAARWMPAAVAAAFLFVIGRFAVLSLEPYGVVSLDVNPSIEFTINNMDRVLYVNGVNDDGKDIIDDLNNKELVNQNIEKAVNVTIDKIKEKGYMSDDRNYVVVAANTAKESHTDKLVAKIDIAITENNEDVQPITIKASDEEITAAREMGTSAGKMIIVNKLDSVTEEAIDKGEWLNRSVADIVSEYDKAAVSSITDEEVKPAHKNGSTNPASNGKNQGASRSSAPSDTKLQKGDDSSREGSTAKLKTTSVPTPTPTPTTTPVPTAVPTSVPAQGTASDPSLKTSSDPSDDPSASPAAGPAPAPNPTPAPEPTPEIIIDVPDPDPEPPIPVEEPVIEPDNPVEPAPVPDPEPAPSEGPSNGSSLEDSAQEDDPGSGSGSEGDKPLNNTESDSESLPE
ncbi:MAG: hypothetical protein K6G58_00680 [Lachnospiraceae bacterium]|nr:hypothetical protein [Lachnospiraceae bacterium]